jgi:NAD(P)-dependent dehydrogenase (short-subunit alcohol dehydrogenase family)
MTGQKPLIAGFGAKTTAEEALAGGELRGKITIVTGGHAGLGQEATRVLANAGATVVVGARDPQKAQIHYSQLSLISAVKTMVFVRLRCTRAESSPILLAT